MWVVLKQNSNNNNHADKTFMYDTTLCFDKIIIKRAECILIVIYKYSSLYIQYSLINMYKANSAFQESNRSFKRFKKKIMRFIYTYNCTPIYIVTHDV